MPFQQTASGLEIQSVAEIVQELNAAHFALPAPFGPTLDLSPTGTFGSVIQYWAAREALIQEMAQKIQLAFDANNAEGTDLDNISALTSTVRKGPDASRSTAGKAIGDDGTVLVTGLQVMNDSDGIVWQIVEGPYTIGEDTTGEVSSVVIEAVDVGPLTFLGSDEFSISTPVNGWTGFEVTSDIEPSEIGRLAETDAQLRVRRSAEVFSGGNDLSAVRANVLRVTDVNEVQVFENRSCSIEVDGIPPGNFETIVTADPGGTTDGLIAQAILNRKPPAAKAFGNTEVSIPDPSQNGLPKIIAFTRPTLRRISVQVIISVNNKEGALPVNWEQLTKDAVLEFGNANSLVGQDVLHQSFYSPVYKALKDPDADVFPFTGLTVLLAEEFTALTEQNIKIDFRSRADFDSNFITAVLAA